MKRKNIGIAATCVAAICLMGSLVYLGVKPPSKRSFSLPPAAQHLRVTDGTVTIADETTAPIALADGSTLALHFLSTPDGYRVWGAVARDEVAVWEMKQVTDGFEWFKKSKPKPSPSPAPTPTPTPPTPAPVLSPAFYAVVFESVDQRQAWQEPVDLWAEETLNKAESGHYLRYDVSVFKQPANSDAMKNLLKFQAIIQGRPLPCLVILDKDGQQLSVSDEPKTVDAFKNLWTKEGGTP